MDIKVNDVTESLLVQIEDALKSSEPINLIIDSNGGDLDCAYRIYEDLRNADSPITAKVKGKCYSSASIILLAVKPENRSCSRLSTFLIHSPILSADWKGINLTQSEVINSTLSEEYSKLLNIYKDRLIIKDEATINSLMRNESIIDAEQAQFLGFVDHIDEYKNYVQKGMNLLNKVLQKLLNEAEATVKTENGEFAVEGGELVVGAKIDAPDGTYIETSTQTKFVVENGVITDVEPQIKKEEEAPAEEAPVEEAKKENEEAPAEETKDEEKAVEEVKEEVATVAEEAQTEVEEATDTEALAKVIEQLSASIAELEQKVAELSAPKEEQKEEEEAPAEEPKVENKVSRKYWGYTTLAECSKENKLSKEQIKSYWK